MMGDHASDAAKFFVAGLIVATFIPRRVRRRISNQVLQAAAFHLVDRLVPDAALRPPIDVEAQPHIDKSPGANTAPANVAP